MKKLLIALLAVVVMGKGNVALAGGEHDHHDSNKHNEERIKHYVAEEPKSTRHALMILKNKTELAEGILKKHELKGQDLEKIHEISYSLEAAVDYLRKVQDSENEEILDRLDEAVQALHYASENHEEENTRKWFMKMSKADKEVHNAF